MTEIFIDPAQSWGGTDIQGRPIARLPIFARLPWDAAQYRSSDLLHECTDDPALWLTTPWDELLGETRDRLDAFWDTHLNPATCQSAALDWLGMVMGFTEDFWDATWEDDFKRFLLHNALGGNGGAGGGAIATEGIWADRGTQITLDAILSSYGLNAYGGGTFQVSDFQAGMAVSHTVWAGDLTFFVRLPQAEYNRGDRPWKDARRFVRNYAPACTQGLVQHTYFRADYSAAAEAVFWREYELSQDAANDFAATYPGLSDRPLSYLAALLDHLLPSLGLAADIGYRAGFYAGETFIPYRLYPFVEAIVGYAPPSDEWRSLAALIGIHRPFANAAVVSQDEFRAGISYPGHLLGGPRPERDHEAIIADFEPAPQPVGTPPDAIALAAHGELLVDISIDQPLPLLSVDPDAGLRAGFMAAGDEITTEAPRLWVELDPTISESDRRYLTHTDHAIRPYNWTLSHFPTFTAGASAAGHPLTRNPDPALVELATPWVTAINTAELQAQSSALDRMQAIAAALCYPVTIAQLGDKLWALCSSAIPQGALPWAVMGWALSRFAGDVGSDRAWDVFLAGQSLAGHPCFPIPTDPIEQAIGNDCQATLTTDTDNPLTTSDLAVSEPDPNERPPGYLDDLLNNLLPALIAAFTPEPQPLGTPSDAIALAAHGELLEDVVTDQSFLVLSVDADAGLRAGFMVAGDEITTETPRLWVELDPSIPDSDRVYLSRADEAIRPQDWTVTHFPAFAAGASAAGHPLARNPSPAQIEPSAPWVTAINAAELQRTASALDRMQAIVAALGYPVTITQLDGKLWALCSSAIPQGALPWAVMGWALSRFAGDVDSDRAWDVFLAGQSLAGHPLLSGSP